MFNIIFSWFGGGVLFVLLYILVSNTLWFLFGSRLIQYLPGVNIKGIAGTFKIATMLVLSVLGTIIWSFKHVCMLMGQNANPVYKDEVSKMIQRGARFIESRRIINKRRNPENVDSYKT